MYLSSYPPTFQLSQLSLSQNPTSAFIFELCLQLLYLHEETDGVCSDAWTWNVLFIKLNVFMLRKKKSHEQFPRVDNSCVWLFVCFFSLCTFQTTSLTSLLGNGEKLDSSAILSSVGSQPNSCASPPIFIILMGACAGVAPACLLGGIWVEKSISVEGWKMRSAHTSSNAFVHEMEWNFLSQSFSGRASMLVHLEEKKQKTTDAIQKWKVEFTVHPPSSSCLLINPSYQPQIASSWVH